MEEGKLEVMRARSFREYILPERVNFKFDIIV